MATTDHSLERGLPASIDAERSILGAILLDNFLYNSAAETLKADDFALDSHRRIYSRMMELAEHSKPIDIVTLAEELARRKEVEAVGGVAYISSLTDGLPRRPNIEHYVKIVRDKAMLRALIHPASTAIARASEQAESADEILDSTESAIFSLADDRVQRGFVGITEIVKESFGSIDQLYERGQRITGLATHHKRPAELTTPPRPPRPTGGSTSYPAACSPRTSSSSPRAPRWAKLPSPSTSPRTPPCAMARRSACSRWKCRGSRCCSACSARRRWSIPTSCAPASSGVTTTRSWWTRSAASAR